MKRENHNNRVIPDILFKCIKILHPESYTSQGVFRVSGNNVDMQEVEREFDTDCIKYNFKNNEDIHVVACILKKYLRDLPEPLLPFNMYDQLIKSADVLDVKKKKDKTF